MPHGHGYVQMGILMGRWCLRVNFTARNVRVEYFRGRTSRQLNVRGFERSSVVKSGPHTQITTEHTQISPDGPRIIGFR